MSDEATPARLEFESAERAAVNAAAFLIGARSVYDAAYADATTHDAAVNPSSRIAQAYRRALDNAAAADLRRNRAADALAAENAADRARRTAQLEQRLEAQRVTEHRNGYVDERAIARAEALEALHDAALPADAPGAWIRAAIEAEQLHDDTLNASAAALADELECAATCTDADRDDDRRLVTCATCGETLILTEPGTITHQLDGPHIFTPAAGDDETEA
jgi:hypothetical protein